MKGRKQTGLQGVDYIEGPVRTQLALKGSQRLEWPPKLGERTGLIPMTVSQGADPLHLGSPGQMVFRRGCSSGEVRNPQS